MYDLFRQRGFGTRKTGRSRPPSANPTAGRAATAPARPGSSARSASSTSTGSSRIATGSGQEASETDPERGSRCDRRREPEQRRVVVPGEESEPGEGTLAEQREARHPRDRAAIRSRSARGTALRSTYAATAPEAPTRCASIGAVEPGEVVRADDVAERPAGRECDRGLAGRVLGAAEPEERDGEPVGDGRQHGPGHGLARGRVRPLVGTGPDLDEAGRRLEVGRAVVGPLVV